MFLSIFGRFDCFFEDLKANCSAIDGRTKFLRGVPEINLFSTDGSGRWLYLLLEPGRAAASSSPFRAGAAHLALQQHLALTTQCMGMDTLTGSFCAAPHNLQLWTVAACA